MVMLRFVLTLLRLQFHLKRRRLLEKPLPGGWFYDEALRGNAGLRVPERRTT